MSPESHARPPHSYLFTVRLWQESVGAETVEIRGEARHALSGEVRFFREWATLTTYLTDKVHELAQEWREGGTLVLPDDLAEGEAQPSDDVNAMSEDYP